MQLTYRSAAEYSLDELVDLLNRGFEGYVVNVTFSLAALLSMLTRDSVDLGLSRVAEANGKSVAVGLIARRGWTVRLAAMGVASEIRGQGVGRGLMDHFLETLPSLGYQRMLLEVIEQNPPAVNLYERVGFRLGRRLVSFQREATTPDEQPPNLSEQLTVTQIDPATVAARLTVDHLADLPWQLSGSSIMVDGPPSHALSTGQGMILISDPSQPVVTIRSIFVEPQHRGQGVATQLVAAVLAKRPEKKWMVPALCPEELSPIFINNGFTRQDLSQFQMSQPLD